MARQTTAPYGETY